MFELEAPTYKQKKVTFSSDEPFSDRIRLPFSNKSFAKAIIGKPGSGKTSFLINALRDRDIYHGVFTKITLVMPSSSMNNINSNNILQQVPPDQHFDSLEDNVDEIREMIEENYEGFIERENNAKRREKPHHQLLILDDVTSQLKGKYAQKMLQQLFQNRRQVRLSIILLAQNLRAIPRQIRSLFTDIVLFKPGNRLDNRVLTEEFLSIEKQRIDDFYNFVFTSNHDFLFLKKEPVEEYYKNYQRIVMNV